VSVTKDQTPQADAPSVAAIRPVSVTEDQTTPQDDDPSVAAIRAALAGGTAGSFKKSLNTCLIIWTLGRSRVPRRRIWIPFTLIAPVVLATHYYWHAFSGLVHLLH
jgi:hypothetical protein